MKKKNNNYTSVKEKLKLEVDKKSDSGIANFTHFLHNNSNGVSKYYKNGAKEYLKERHDKLNIVEEPEFQYYLPIKWDIPFPPPSTVIGGEQIYF